jgi:hypothetical protein
METKVFMLSKLQWHYTKQHLFKAYLHVRFQATISH